MFSTFKKLYDRNKRFMESYGGEATRNTYLGQLNFESGKIFFVLYITLLVWLPYIPNDLKLHQYPMLAVALRLALTGISVVFILLRLTKPFKNRPNLLLMGLMSYFYVGTSLVTATAGPNAPAYIGGFTFILMMPVFAPFPFKFKALLSVASLAMFFIVGMFTGLDFTDNAVLYSINDLFSAIFICLLLSNSQDKVRYEAWTQRQQLNSMISQQEKNLATIFKLASEAENASKTKSDFLANMSHEIRTPMNAIIGISELMMQKEMPEDIYEDAQAIKSAANSLLAIINDILDITKIEAGKLEIIPVEYSLASLFHDVCSIIRPRLSEKNILFITYVNSRLPHKLYGDEIRVRQILLNLLSNAAKYTEQGHVSFSLDGEIEGDTVYLKISVNDSGVGIKEEDIGELFNKFVQVDTHKNRGIEGTGLGLAISKQLCMMMGGDIGVTSEYGVGSTFSVSIAQKIVDEASLVAIDHPEQAHSLIYEVRPLYEESARRTFTNLNIPHTAISRQDEFFRLINEGSFRYIFIPLFLYGGMEQSLSRLVGEAQIVLMAEFGETVKSGGQKMLSMPISCFTVAGVLNDEEIHSFNDNKEALNTFIAPEAKILIVDDIAINLKVAEGLMSHFKMQIDVCLSGEMAVELARQNSYDIIFMDHMMPEMDGIEAAHKIRELGPAYESLPIIALTANAVGGMKEMFIANGLNDFLAKPIEISKLNMILGGWLPKDKIIKGQRDKAKECAKECPKEDELVIELANIDTALGISQAGGSKSGYLEILRYFCSDAQKKLGEIAEAWENGQQKSYITCVHAIKGAAANIGAMHLSELARQLEQAAQNQDNAYIDRHNEAFLAELKQTHGRIDSFIRRQKEQKQECQEGAEAMAPEIRREHLQKLKTALAEFDTLTIDETISLLSKGATAELMEGVAQNVLIFEYEQASEDIDAYLAAMPKS